LPYRFAPRKPLLTQRHRNLHLAFARNYVNKPIDFWCCVLLTDKTRTAIRCDTIKIRVRRNTGEQFNILSSTMKHPLAVMMWGCFAANSVGGRILFLKKHQTCNTAGYITVINQQVRSSAKSLFDGMAASFCKMMEHHVLVPGQCRTLSENSSGRHWIGHHSHLTLIQYRTYGRCLRRWFATGTLL